MPHPTAILPEPYRPPSRQQIERARTMYAQGFTVSRILAACDMSLGTLYYWLDGGPRENGVPLYPPLARRRVVVGKRRPPLGANRVSLTGRLWRTAERQTRDIEERLARPGAASPERERDVRMLGTLVRTLRDLSSFDSAAGPEQEDAAVVPALEAARAKLAREKELREAEQTAGTIRHMVSCLRDITKIEALQAGRTAASARAQQEKAKAQAGDDEMRRALARRIEGMVAAEREKKEGGAG
jgi:hypothetical protein